MSSWKESWNASMSAGSSTPPCGQTGKDFRQCGLPQVIGNVPMQNPWMTCFRKYATFSGRARRKEYWCFVLINNLVCSIIMGIAAVCAANLSRAGHCGQRDMEAFLAIGIIVCAVYGLVMMLPTLSVTVRRLHDTGRSGWFMWLTVIPVIGPIMFFVTMLLDSQPGANRYGPNPKMLDGNSISWQIR